MFPGRVFQAKQREHIALLFCNGAGHTCPRMSSFPERATIPTEIGEVLLKCIAYPPRKDKALSVGADWAFALSAVPTSWLPTAYSGACSARELVGSAVRCCSSSESAFS